MVFQLFKLQHVEDDLNFDSKIIANFKRDNIPYIQIVVMDISLSMVIDNLKIISSKGYYILSDFNYETTECETGVILTMSLDAYSFIHSLMNILASTDSRSAHNAYFSISKYIDHIFHEHRYTYSVILAFSRLIHKDRRKNRGIPDLNSQYIGIHRKLNSILELVTNYSSITLDALHAYLNLDDDHIVQDGIRNIIKIMKSSQYDPFLHYIQPGMNLNKIQYPVKGRGKLPGHFIYYTIVADHEINHSIRFALFQLIKSNIKRDSPVFRRKEIELDINNIRYNSNIDRVFHFLENRERNPYNWNEIISSKDSSDYSISKHIAFQKFYTRKQDVSIT